MAFKLTNLKSRVALADTRVGNKLPGYDPSQKPSQQPGYRIRGRAGQEIRAAFLRLHPLCLKCYAKGLIVVATEVDHIVALTNGGEDTERNKQALCVPCHQEKSKADLSGRRW